MKKKLILILFLAIMLTWQGTAFAEFQSGDSTNLAAISSNINTIINNYLNAAGASSLGKQIYEPIVDAINYSVDSFASANNTNLLTIQSKLDGVNLRLNSLSSGGYLADTTAAIKDYFSEYTGNWSTWSGEWGQWSEIQTLASQSINTELYNIADNTAGASWWASRNYDILQYIRDDLTSYNSERLDAEAAASAQREGIITAISVAGRSVNEQMYNLTLYTNDNIGNVRSQVELLDQNTETRNTEAKSRQEGIFFETTRFLGATITLGFCNALSGVMDVVTATLGGLLSVVPDYTLSFQWSDDQLSKLLYTVNLFFPLDMISILMTLWVLQVGFMVTKGVILRLVRVLQ